MLVSAVQLYIYMGFPGGASGKEPACPCRRHKTCGFDPWIGKILWNRKWQPTPVFLHGKFHGQRSLGGYIQSTAKDSTNHGALVLYVLL